MSIKGKLIILLLAIAVIPLAFVSTLTFHNYKNSLEAVRTSALRDTASFKDDTLETYFSGLKANMAVTQSLYNIKQNLPVLTRLVAKTDDPEFLAARKMLDLQLSQMQLVWGLSDIMLMNPDGRIVYTSNPEHYSKEFLSLLPDPQQKGFSEARQRIYFSDVFLSKVEGNKAEMLVTAPAFGHNGIFIGVIVFEVDMAPIYKLVQDTTGLGKTGETLVGKRIGHEVVYLNPLRHDPQPVLKRKITLGMNLGLPMQEATQGREGSGQMIDYRGKKVIAAWRYVSSLDWGLVAKIDTEEAFSEAENLQRLIIMITAIVFVLAGIMAFSIAQSISGPIQKLTRGAEIVGKGNLDYKVGIPLKDEVGQLSRSFDQMTRNLKTVMASRDELNKEVAERKAAEESLKRSNESLEQFAYVASHDLQEPLRVMSSYSQLLEKRYKNKLDQDANEFIDFIVDAAKRMQKLIADILAYSRVGRKDIAATKEDLNPLVQKVLDGMAATLESSAGTVTYDKLPMVTVHETSIMQVFQNLIGNALKFHGKAPPRVHISARKDGEEWVFSVRDNGLGIESQYHERIFQIFQRLHSREEYSGTGIGLSICKKIVTNYGGRIWVESEYGKGSTFYFTILA